MTYVSLDRLLRPYPGTRVLSDGPSLEHDAWRHQVLAVAGGLQARGIRRLAVHLEDATHLATALFAAWRAGVDVLLPSDLQPATRTRWAAQVDLWLTDKPGDTALDTLVDAPLEAADLDLDRCTVALCTSGSSGEAKRIDKRLRQLANEIDALEHLWGERLGDAWVIGSVAAQHIYGLLFRVLWPLCAGRGFERRAQPFPEDLQRTSRAHATYAWVASPALLKRMGDNLDWPSLRAVRQVFSSGGELPEAAAQVLHQRLGQWPTQVLGSSETGGIAWREGDTWWQPFAGVDVQQDAQGALQVSSPYLPPGHVEQGADAMEFDAQGRIRLLGRLDRIVKLEEKRVSLPLLEQALMAHAWVDEARLEQLDGQRAYLGALLSLTPAGLHALRNQGRRALLAALREHLAAHCEATALPRRWRLLRCLPVNAQGKLPKAEALAMLRAPRSMHPECLAREPHETGLQLTLAVPPDLACFSGHFPASPVLPGVVQVDWAIALAASTLGLTQRFAGMEVIKFQRLVRPGDTLLLNLRNDAFKGKLYFAYTCEGEICSSGRIVLEATHA